MKDPLVRLFESLLLLCLITLHESSEGLAKKTNSTAPDKFQNLLDILGNQSAVIKSLEDALTALKADQQKAAPKPSLSIPTILTTISAATVPDSVPDDQTNEPTTSVSPASKRTTTMTPDKFQYLFDLLRNQSAVIKSLKNALTALKASQQKAAQKPSISTPTISATISAKTEPDSVPDNQTNEPTTSVSPASKRTTTTSTEPEVATPSKSTTEDLTTSHTASPHIATTTKHSEAGNSMKSTNEPTTTQISTTSTTTFSTTQPKRVKTAKTTKSRTTLKTDRGTVSNSTAAKNDSEVPANSSAGEQPLNSTTKETPTPKHGSSDAEITTKQSDSTSDDSSFLHQGNRFPALFMVALVFTVLVYFGYHNRNKINLFVKTGYSRSKQEAKGYVTVKLDDDIDLPRDANREYIY